MTKDELKKVIDEFPGDVYDAVLMTVVHAESGTCTSFVRGHELVIDGIVMRLVAERCWALQATRVKPPL